MAVKKKYKKLTNAEKKINKQIREELREKGILPPVKQRLNRKKFAQEVNKELQEDNMVYGDIWVGIDALRPSGKSSLKITEEEIGVLKAVKIALEYRKYVDKMKEENPSMDITFEMLYENVIKPILDL